MDSTLIADPDYQAFCEERLDNPYPFFHRLRAEDPVHWCDQTNLWLVTRYEDVFSGLRDSRLSSSRMGMYRQALPDEMQREVEPLLDHISKWIILRDQPDHSRLRRLVSRAFTPRILATWRSRIEERAETMLIEAAKDGQMDFLHDYCYPLPATVICEMMGIPRNHQDDFRHWAEDVMNFSTGGGPPMVPFAAKASKSLERLLDILNGLIDRRRHELGDDLISALIRAEEAGDKLTHEELLSLGVFLFIAGHETTMNLIANALVALLANPEEFDKLKNDVDGKMATAVEELLRYDTSVTRAVRQATEDTEIGGKSIKEGQTVIFLLGAANRDPAQFLDPDRLDLERTPNAHVSFGWGPHFCLGGPLARIEIELALRAVLRHTPNIRRASDDLQWRPTMGVRALMSLPVYC
jgi:pimeloyl-[acyl-carrier protein] synthase